MIKRKRELQESHKSKEFALPDEDVEKLVDSCKTTTEKFIIITLLYSGMRVGELCHLRKEWINWQDEVINVPMRQACSCKKCVKFRKGVWMPKTRKGVRSIKIIEPRLREVLRAYFTLNSRFDYTETGAWYVVKRVARRTDIKTKIFPHSLRATAATIFAHKVSAPTLAYIMGWEDLNVAESYVQSAKKRAIAEMEKVV